jgi:hypothetical protein
VAAAFVYEPVGVMLAQTTPFSLLSCYVAVYSTVIVIMLVLFAWIRRSTGAKLVSSDAFGNAEYYLGMAAGAFRYSCVLLIILAFLNARYFTADELRAGQLYQERNYGSQFFPSYGAFQAELFNRSLTGTTVRNYLSMFLIRPTAPEEKSLGHSGIAQSREKDVNQMLDKR